MASETKSKKDYAKELRRQKAQKDYDAMLTACREALASFPGDRFFLKQLHAAQVLYVDEKLHSDLVKKMEAANDYETLQKIVQKLLQVFPGSPVLLKRLKDLTAVIEKDSIEKRKAQFADADKKIEALMAEDKWEEALYACIELLNADPQRKASQKLLDRIQKKRAAVMEKDLVKYFDHAVPALRADYKKNKKDFIRV